MSRVGTTILRDDFILIRDKVSSILGSGNGQRGYGQQVLSDAFSPSGAPNGTEITRAQWIALKNDITNIKWHQDGVQPVLPDIAPNSIIRFGPANPNSNFNTLIDLAILTRFKIGPVLNRSIITSVRSVNRTVAWSKKAETELVVNFNNSDEARWFFNSGGKIRFLSSRTGGASTPQNASWTNLLGSTGIIEFGADVPIFLNFYSLTNEYQVVSQTSGSGSFAYLGNRFVIRAKCNVSDNRQGGATQITFEIFWEDSYEPPGDGTDDLVDGTLSLAVSELKASGPLVQGGLFTIASPASYSLLPIRAV